LQDISDADGSLYNAEFNHIYIIEKVWKIRALFDTVVYSYKRLLACVF
jgi:hypothetical protein